MPAQLALSGTAAFEHLTEAIVGQTRAVDVEQLLEVREGLAAGFVLMPDETIYCAGDGSQHTKAADGTDVDTLRSFKRVGRCAGIGGVNTARGCVSSKKDVGSPAISAGL